MRAKARPAAPGQGRTTALPTAAVRAGMTAKKRASRPTSSVREDLAVEFYSRVRLALTEFGVTPKEQERAIARARPLKTPPRVSGPLLRDARGLCALLLEWSREAKFLDPDGKPRILDIEGPGATFESLARRFLPAMPVKKVVAMACATAEVATRPGRKIALLGSILVILSKSTENLLAHGIRQIDQLLSAILHNAVVHRKGVGAKRLERMVLGVISRSQFNDLMRELKPQIDDLLQRVDAAVEPRQPKTRAAVKNSTAFSVGVYVSQEEDFERAGIDPDSFVTPT